MKRTQLSEEYFSDWRTCAAMDARVKVAVAALGGIAIFEVSGKPLEGRDMSLVRFTGGGYEAGGLKVVLTFNLHAGAGSPAWRVRMQWRRSLRW